MWASCGHHARSRCSPRHADLLCASSALCLPLCLLKHVFAGFKTDTILPRSARPASKCSLVFFKQEVPDLSTFCRLCRKEKQVRDVMASSLASSLLSTHRKIQSRPRASQVPLLERWSCWYFYRCLKWRSATRWLPGSLNVVHLALQVCGMSMWSMVLHSCIFEQNVLPSQKSSPSSQACVGSRLPKVLGKSKLWLVEPFHEPLLEFALEVPVLLLRCLCSVEAPRSWMAPGSTGNRFGHLSHQNRGNIANLLHDSDLLVDLCGLSAQCADRCNPVQCDM